MVTESHSEMTDFRHRDPVLYVLVFLAVSLAAFATYGVAWGADDFPYGQSTASKVLIGQVAGTYILFSPVSSSSHTYVYAWSSSNGAALQCGSTPIFKIAATTYQQTYLDCVGLSLKWVPTGGGSYDAMVVYSTSPYAAVVPVISPNEVNVDVDVTASNSFSPVNNITSSGSFSISSASFSLDTSSLESAISRLPIPWYLALPFFLFLFALFGVIRSLRK